MVEAETLFLNAKRAFESGQYGSAITDLTQAQAYAKRGGSLHGEILLWQVMAYQAAGDIPAALELCRRAVRHPHGETRKTAKNILYVLEAPALEMRPEWKTEIPDLSKLEPKDRKNWGQSQYKPPPMPKAQEKTYIPEPVDRTQVEVEDDRLLWGGLVIAAILLGIVAWVGFWAGG